MRHKPVLLKEVIENVNLKDGDVFVDMTLGSAGHSHAVCSLGLKNLTLIGIDKDEDAIQRSANNLSNCDARIILEASSNYEVGKVLARNEIVSAQTILLDLGISSEQIEESGRGFTFQRDEPLLMSMKKNPGQNDLTAELIVNQFQEESLADIIYGFGEEKYARRIAKGIVEYRKTMEIRTTGELVEIIKSSTPVSYHKGRIHPATKTFQAIRIVVNDEYESLPVTLGNSFEVLSPGGRLLVISFHSHEDRIVKRFMRDRKDEGSGNVLTQKPIRPTEKETKENPRSRSSKLRILEKI
jgi:16S rRNA (cytosine1402-N4)-methyltransferase